MADKALEKAPGAGTLVLSGAEAFVDEGKPTTHFGLAVVIEASGKESTVMIPDVTGIKQGSPLYITKRIAIEGKNLQAFLTESKIKLPEALEGIAPKGTGTGYFTKVTYDNPEAKEIELEKGQGTIPAGEYVTFEGIPDVYEVETGIEAPGKLTLKTPLGDVLNSGTAVKLGRPGLIADTEIACEAFYYSTADNGPVLMMFTLNFRRGLIRSLTGSNALGKLFDIKGASLRVIKCNKETFPRLQEYVAELAS